MAMTVREAAAIAAMAELIAINQHSAVLKCDICEEALLWADAMVAALNEGKPKRKRETFVADNPPTVDEVAAYCRERSNNVDPQRFVDYYISNGWKIGKAKAPMKNWKAAIRGPWEQGNANTLGDWANGAG